jgi:uncharacterized membrane protein
MDVSYRSGVKTQILVLLIGGIIAFLSQHLCLQKYIVLLLLEGFGIHTHTQINKNHKSDV